MAQDLIASSEHRVVVGLGATGLSCARYLYKQGASFSVIDTRRDPPGLAELNAEMPDVKVYAGVYPVELVEQASELIVSPGLSMDDPLVRQALAADVAVVGDVDLFMREAAAPVIGITGSKSIIQFIPYEKVFGKDFEDMQRRVPSTDKLVEYTGVSPEKSLDFILERVIESFKSK